MFDNAIESIQLDYVITQLNCVANVIELRWEHNQIAFVTQSNCVTCLENNFVQKKNWEIQTGVDSVKDVFLRGFFNQNTKNVAAEKFHK
jgi:hypothetical protein